MSEIISDGKSLKDRHGINEKIAIEGYEIDKKLLSGSRNQSLAKQSKVKDNTHAKLVGLKARLTVFSLRLTWKK